MYVLMCLQCVYVFVVWLYEIDYMYWFFIWTIYEVSNMGQLSFSDVKGAQLFSYFIA